MARRLWFWRRDQGATRTSNSRGGSSLGLLDACNELRNVVLVRNSRYSRILGKLQESCGRESHKTYIRFGSPPRVWSLRKAWLYAACTHDPSPSLGSRALILHLQQAAVATAPRQSRQCPLDQTPAHRCKPRSLKYQLSASQAMYRAAVIPAPEDSLETRRAASPPSREHTCPP